MRSLVLLAASVLFGFATKGQSGSSEPTNPITTAVPFLDVSANPLQMSTGQVGVVSSPLYTETAFTANPALLANGFRYAEARSSYTNWFSDPSRREFKNRFNIFTESVAFAFHERHAIGLYSKIFDYPELTFTDNIGQAIENYSPIEVVNQFNYATWFPFGLSIGIGIKYVYSNLTGGLNVGGQETRPAHAFSSDLGLHYRKKHKISETFGIGFAIGLSVDNLGNKVTYLPNNGSDFQPTSMQLGIQLNLQNKIGNLRIEQDIGYQIHKLLVPSPPEYDNDYYIDNSLPEGNDPGELSHPDNRNPNYREILAGKDPDVGVFQGIWNSFSDAPGGIAEEWREVRHSQSYEIRLIPKDWLMFAIRQGYYYQHRSKGRQYATIGTAISIYGTRLDIGGFIPAGGAGRLRGAFFIGIGYRLAIGPGEKYSMPE